MSIKHPLGVTALVCLGLFSSVKVPTAAQEIIPQKHSLAIPIAVAPSAERSVECVVPFGPAIPISALAFSPDGNTLAVGGYQEVLVWDLAGAALSKRVGAGQLSDCVHALAFSQDGRSLAVAEGTPHGAGAVKVFDLETGEPTMSFEEPKDVVYAFALSPDGKLLAAGGADRLVHVWSVEEKKLVVTIQEHDDWVLGVSFSPDGSFLATGSADRTARVWEVGTWQPVVKMEQTETVHGVAFSPDGELLALAVGGPNDRAIRIRRRDNAEQVSVIDMVAAVPLDVVWAAQVNRIYVPSSDKTVKAFDAGDGALVADLGGHGDWVYSVALSADAARLASASADGTVKLWSASENRLLATLIQLSPGTDEWLIITPEGYLATSLDALEWKTTNLATPPEELTSLFQNPELVREAISGNQVAPPALLGPSPSGAQPPQPHINFVFPAGGQRGTTIETTVSGTDLQDADAVHVSGAGVTGSVVNVEDPNTVRISVALAPDAELGERDLRVLTPGGLSNRFRFFVGELPEVNEAEPNSEPSEAQPLGSLPILINGQVLPADRDFFRFTAEAGQTLVCEVDARRVLPYIADVSPGWLEACLTLYDASGEELAYVDDFRFHSDPVLVYNVPTDGQYLVGVRDVIYRGREDFIYRLSIGALPYITHIFPLGCQRDSDAQVELHGVNLPTESVSFNVPADSPPLRQVELSGDGPTSNALPFAVGDAGETQEAEPNDAVDQANRVEVPVTINGRIQQSGDTDCFIFNAEQGQTLVIEVQARRLDSPLDSMITVLNSQGEELLEQDDTDTGEPLITHYADSRLDYTFPETEDYILRINDVQGNGGEEYAYRISVAPLRPDYVLRILPDNARVAQGDSVVVTVSALGKDGFDGEISLWVENLPEGFVASDALIPAGQNLARLTITAPPDAAVGLVTPTIAGRATVDDRETVRNAEPAEEVMQAFSYQHQVPTKEYALAIIGPPSFTLSTSIPPTQVLEVRPESKVQVVVTASRKEEAKGEITLAADQPPEGVSVDSVVIPADQDEATITLNVAKEVPVGLRQNVIITGTMTVGDQTGTSVAPAIPIQVVAPPQ